MPLVNALGAPIGTVRAWQTAGGVTFRIDAGGLPHGIHGIHVHAVGRCDPPDFTSAGPHWNPAGEARDEQSGRAARRRPAQRRSRRQWRAGSTRDLPEPTDRLAGRCSMPTARRWSSTPGPTII